MLFSVMPKTVCSMLEESVNYSRQKSTVIPTFVLYFFFFFALDIADACTDEILCRQYKRKKPPAQNYWYYPTLIVQNASIYQVNLKYLICTNTRSFSSAIITFSVFFMHAPLVFQVCNILTS